MLIPRDDYLNKLLTCRGNQQIKLITGIRRCGKSFLLKTLFRDWLLKNGTQPEDILTIEMDSPRDLRFRNPLVLSATIDDWAMASSHQRYLFIDEIQMCDVVDNPYNPRGAKITFYDSLNGFLHLKNLDVYVTGSNSKMLSSDISTEFRGRGTEIRLHPLSFREYFAAVSCDKRDALADYCRFGGMPFCLTFTEATAKEEYLKSLFNLVYINDILERRKIIHTDLLGKVVDCLCSSCGSLTTPNNITRQLKQQYGEASSIVTISSYINHLLDAFLFSVAKRYDVRGRKYFDYPYKYYCEDIGLRNARLGFRQQETTHIMENIIYNELILRGYSVDVGYVESLETQSDGHRQRVPREIDFVLNRSGRRLYIQSAYVMESEEKRQSELKPFSMTGDSFQKIIVRNDVVNTWFDEQGVMHINLLDFLLNPQLLN